MVIIPLTPVYFGAMASKLPAGCRIKLDRAEEHLKLLYRSIRAFEAEKPYRVTYEDNKQARQRIYHVSQVATPPPKWSALIGDCIHNFRSALDHVAYHIVKTYGVPDRNTQFPLCLTPARYPDQAKQCFGERARQGLKTAVERLQPYHRRNKTPNLYALWQLHRLDIIDKHRQLLPVVMANPLVSMRTQGIPYPPVIPGPFQGSTDVLRVQVPYGPDGPVKMKVIPTVQIQLREVEIDEGQPSTLLLEESLNSIQDAVRHVLRALLGFYN
jgi:hypothetical protein